MTRKRKQTIPDFTNRRHMVLGFLLAIMMLLFWRAVYLHVINSSFLQNQGNARHMRVIPTPAQRGIIMDRHGEPLAISVPTRAVWVDTRFLNLNPEQFKSLAKTLGMSVKSIHRKIAKATRAQGAKPKFVYLKRQMPPVVANKVKALGFNGVYLKKDTRRYYPTGEVAGHVVGFTNIDDKGQHGVELAYNSWLAGVSGSKRVRKDNSGRFVEVIGRVREKIPGRSIKLSIDHRLQYLAYRELKAAVKRHKARSGSLIMLDADSGEVLAMVNQPSFNPNDRHQYLSKLYRNRAVTDPFEPGSTIKPFVIAAALQSRKYHGGAKIDTRPGSMVIDGTRIRDAGNYGVLDFPSILSKSSNVGVSKVALELGRVRIWEQYQRFGFGRVTSSGFPGESSGVLNHYEHWNQVELASVSFGYGMSTTLLQLAQAYSIIANGGYMRPVTIVKTNNPVHGERIIPSSVANEVRSMLERVVVHGTGSKGSVSGYSMAGKTGTVRKLTKNGYSDKKYLSLFAGFGPAKNPRVVMVVLIDEPKAGEYYGGEVAAPVFSKVMQGALRLMNVAPDRLPINHAKVQVADERS